MAGIPRCIFFQGTRNERAQFAVVDSGRAIINAGLTSLLAVAVLASGMHCYFYCRKIGLPAASSFHEVIRPWLRGSRHITVCSVLRLIFLYNNGFTQ